MVYGLLGGRSSPAEREGASKDIGHGGNGPSRAEAHMPPGIGCILMKRPEEGALGGPVLAGTP